MKTYVIVTGALFALLTVAHAVRMVWAEPQMADDPWYIAITAVTAALAVWAGFLLRRAKP